MGKIVIIVGIRGVGKTSLTDRVAPNFKGLKTMNFSDVMLKLCIQKGYVKDVDEIRKMSTKQQIEMKTATWDAIAKMPEDILMATHAFVEHTGRFVPGLPIEQIKKLKGLCGLFYIDVDNDTLRSRAAKDKKRIREGMTDLQLDNYRYANISALSYLSTALDIPFYIIFNEDGKLDQAAEVLGNHLADALSNGKA